MDVRYFLFALRHYETAMKDAEIIGINVDADSFLCACHVSFCRRCIGISVSLYSTELVRSAPY